MNNKRIMFEQYSDSLARLYPEFTDGKTNVDGGGKNSLRFLTRSVTFQVTDNCNLACFVAGTKILMSDYTYKNIEDIQVGDEVIGFDEHTEKGKQLKLVPTKVTHTFVRHDETMRVTTKDGNSVVCTKEHPFLVNNNEWKRAIDIQAQDNLFTCVDKNCLKTEVKELQYYGLYERVYNFETDIHTYVANNFLVHNCSYCYQINKGKRKMSFEVAKKYVDLLLSGDKGFKEYGITPELSKGIITEFIGGEPFLEVELIDDICDYMYTRMILTNHPWLKWWRISICSNGVLYRDPRVQAFLAKWRNRLSFSVTIDGNKELHDSCRVFPDGSPSYDLAFDAASDWMAKGFYMGSKITIAPGNVDYLLDAIKHMVDSGYEEINANCVYEEGWNNELANKFYHKLIEVSDYFIDNDLVDTHYLSLFVEDFFHPKKVDDLQCWCWGAGTPILTDKGYVPIETLKVGDMVYTEDGTLHKIINTMNHYADNCVSFSTSGGFPLVCTDNHKVFAMPFDYMGNKGKVHYKDFDKYEVKDLTDMRDMVEMSKLKVEGHTHINKAVAMLVGRFIGDGWVDSDYPICCAFDEADELRAMYHDAGINYTVTSGKTCLTFTSPKYKNIDNDNFNTFITLCDACGKLSTGKHFPIDWTDWDFESIKALLNGYLSADGYHKKSKNRMSAKTVSYALANDIVLALRTLGYHPTISVNNHVTNMIQNRPVNCHTQYEISWSLDKTNSRYQKDIDDKSFSSHVTTHRAENQMVYNITVEDNHSYMAGAYMSSNCGGTGMMLACDPDGKLFPCLRYMESSVGTDVPAYTIGDVDAGIGSRCIECERIDCMNAVNRRSQSNDECFYCPIAEGCSYCSAYNYQTFGTPDSRATFICCMHKARALANAYFWSRWNIKTSNPKVTKLWVPKEWALEIITEDEWNDLINVPNIEVCRITKGVDDEAYIKGQN